MSATSSSSHVMNELKGMRKSLEKEVKDVSSDERIFDLLSALEKMPVTPDMIKKAKIGNLVAEIRGKFDHISNRVTDKAKYIMSEWKKAAAAVASGTVAHNKGTEPDSSSGTSAAVKTGLGSPLLAITETETSTASAASDAPGSSSHRSHQIIEPAHFNTDPSAGHNDTAENIKLNRSIDYLTAARRSIYTALHGALKEGIHDAKIQQSLKYLALKIEDALDASIASTRNPKQYLAKARTLTFNLKKNQALRSSVVAGSVTVDRFISMTPQELACQELQSARERQNEAELEGRRSDWLEANREAIQQTLNLDPSNVWEYDEDDEARSEPDVDPDP